MAFIVEENGHFTLRNGRNFKIIETFLSREDAQNRMFALHRKNQPSRENRGETARKRYKQKARKGLFPIEEAV